MKKRQSVASKEFVEAVIFADINPTLQAVSFAFPLKDVAPSTTVVGQWSAAGWVNGQATAQCLTGPASTNVLPVGNYDVYVKWTEAPEVPMILVGELEVY